MKKNIWIVMLIAAFAGVFLYYFVFRETENTVHVTVKDSLSVNKVRIQRGFHSINKESDAVLISKGLHEKVFERGNPSYFEKRIGENDFLVVYDEQYYAVFRHFILNDFYDGIPNGHAYHFDIQKEDEQLIVTVTIKGEFSEQFKRRLIPVADAPYSLYGRKLKEAQNGIY